MTSARGTVIAVFARLDSKRLPGKALTDLAGRPLLGRVLDRLRAATASEPLRGTPIVLATTDRPADDPIAAFGAAEGVSVFRGDCEDVAGRCLACADAQGAGRVVRISGDSPFIDAGVLRAVIAGATGAGAPDLVTNVFPRTYPPGVSVESIATAALRRMLDETADPQDREHVTRHIYANPDRFRIVNVAAPDDRYAGVTLTVDTPEDLDKATWIAARLGPAAVTADLDTVVALARQWPHGKEAAA
ncbi:MAG TPA: NTP transferase domain-containing protein [Azospirillum sp.]